MTDKKYGSIGPGWIIGPGWESLSEDFGNFGTTEFYYYYIDAPTVKKPTPQPASSPKQVDWTQKATDTHNLEVKADKVLTEAYRLYTLKRGVK